MKKLSSAAIVLLAAVALLYTTQAQTYRRSQEGQPSANVAARPNQSRNDSPNTRGAAREAAPTSGYESNTRLGPANNAISAEETALTTIYRVGVGDVLDIRLLNSTSNRSTLFTVVDAGWIDFPLVGGSMTAAGLTTDEIQARLGGELKRRAVQNDPQLSVGVRQYASHPVTITGLVENPGTKMLRREAVPLYVILADAQPRTNAGRATIMRTGVPALAVDLSDTSAMNVIIKSGDVINLSPRPQDFYYIAGLVKAPGQKAFHSGITLLQAILAAGGLSRSTDVGVEVSREGTDGRLTTITYKLKEIKTGKVRDPRLEAGDRIEVVR